ncbi:PREDICTED: uncharacterized protein LOC109585712 [Amphimedon queenslandica]|uniref:Uncharacterized protein n=1 Tax=Amphimedon queenslandica TaxID=400682 RepID=A0AAN0JK73_AMPQE|nr:PREDICTED: uncharacterized protein LOC109585712 [Amphimedon queenslandica]|eukprot:XP_019857398.1 PREDICTED: uncharacterized protein LOC109585712 [Amphimedon queenslandica]
MRVKEIQQNLSLGTDTSSASYRIRRGMRMEIEQLQLLLTNKTGLLDQNESLIDIKRELAELKEQISVISAHIFNKGEENEDYRDVIREWRKKLTLLAEIVKLRDEDDDKGEETVGVVEWDNDRVFLTKPSADQCQEVIIKLKDNSSQNHIYLKRSSPFLAYLLLSKVLDIRTIKRIDIKYTKITKNVIVLLSDKITNSSSLDTLVINNDSINDDGVIALTQSLMNNKSVTGLHLCHNPGITSTSAQSLAELLLYNHTLSSLYLRHTNIDTDGLHLLMESLRTNTQKKIWLDTYKRLPCSSFPHYKAIKKRLYFF